MNSSTQRKVMTKRSMSVITPEKDVHRLEGTTYRDRQKVALELNDRSQRAYGRRVILDQKRQNSDGA